MIQRVVLLATLLAVANAFSTTPLFGLQLGHSGADTTLATATDAAGNLYVAGTTTSSDFDQTMTTGGPTGTSGSARIATFPTPSTGFVAKYAFGNPVPKWFIPVNAAGVSEVTAVVAGGDYTYFCGRSNAAFAVTTSAGTYQAANAGGFDVFVVAVNATTGALAWGKTVESASDESCRGLAYTPAGNDGRGGVLAFTGASNENSVDGAYIMLSFSDATAIYEYNDGLDLPFSYVARCDGIDGTNAGLMHASWHSGEYIVANLESPGDWPIKSAATIGRAIAFDSNSHAFVLSSIGSTGTDYAGTAGTTNVGLTIFSNISMFNAAKLQEADVAAASGGDSFGWDRSLLWSALMGGEGNDVPTGLSIILSGTNVADRNVALLSTRLAISGYSQGLLGTVFRFRALNYNSPLASGDVYQSGVTREATSQSAPWFTAGDAKFTGGAGTAAVFYGNTTIQGSTSGMACVAGDCFIAGTLAGGGQHWMGGKLQPFLTNNFTADAVVFRVNGVTGAAQWIEGIGSVGTDSGNAVAVAVLPVGLSPAPRPVIYFGAQVWANATLSPYSAAPVLLRAKGSGDSVTVAYDDTDDCGFSPPPAPFVAPYGLNACNVTDDFNANPGAALCLDEPGFPLCFCNMQVQSTGVGLCNSRGWDCGFMAPYFYSLLNVCDCPQLPQRLPNPLDEVAPRLINCAPNVCNFGTYTGRHAKCLPLVLDFINTCAASNKTSATDKTYIGAFQGLYAGCSSNTGGDSSSTLVFGDAPASSTPTSTVVAAAIFAGVALNAAADLNGEN